MATVNTVVYAHHQKSDGTFNVKIKVYHNSEKKLIDTQHYVTQKQLDSKGKIKDKFLIKLLEETLESYREAISELGTKLNYFSAEELKSYLKIESLI